MSHAINMNNGRASIAYVGEKPWHGLGQELTEGANLETWAEEAGMNFRICRSRVRFGADDAARVWEDKHVLFRCDNKAPLAVVSSNYKIVQPAQVLEFFRDLTERQGFTREVAGVLYAGGQYWATARTGDGFTLPGGDVVAPYLLLVTSADGTLSTQAKFTAVRAVCKNTIGAALGDGRQSVKVSHRSTFDAAKVKVDLGIMGEQWATFTDAASELADKKISRRDALMILIDSLGDRAKFDADAKKESEAAAMALQSGFKGMARILSLFDGEARGASLASSEGTAWGLVNAATEYYDHEFGRTRDNRLSSAYFGANAALKVAVADAALAL